MGAAGATSVEGMASRARASAPGVPSRVGTSIRASIGNLVDSAAAPYSVSAAHSSASTSVTVSVTVIQATTLRGIARSTLTATILPWAATIRILAQRINVGLITESPHPDGGAAIATYGENGKCPAEVRSRIDDDAGIMPILNDLSAQVEFVELDYRKAGASGGQYQPAGTLRSSCREDNLRSALGPIAVGRSFRLICSRLTSARGQNDPLMILAFGAVHDLSRGLRQWACRRQRPLAGWEVELAQAVEDAGPGEERGQPQSGSRGSCRPVLELLVGHGGKFPDEGGDGPDFRIIDASGSEAGHTRHANAVTDDPEQFARLAVGGDFLEVGGAWIEPLGEFGPINAGRAVAVNAAACRECASTGADRGGVIQVTRGPADGWRSMDA
jgi:hypothetical protein